MRIYLPSLFNQLMGDKEIAFYDLLTINPKELNLNLSLIARWMAEDMARNGYFKHTDSLGRSPNERVLSGGFTLPDHYPPVGNTVESLVAGTDSPRAALDALLRSPSHGPHVRGEGDFLLHKRIGIGYYSLKGSPHSFYWVFLSIP